MAGGRTIKLARQIQRDLSVILDEFQSNLKSGTLITITEVVVTGDLGLAKVYISVMPLDERQTVLEEIESNIKPIRHNLALKIKNQVRKIPELQFYIDDTFDKAAKIDALLNQIKKDS